jgi:Uma2 family endonuclease
MAPVDALLSEFDVVVPDVLYVSNGRSHYLTEKNLQGPSDLVIEILSPSTKRRDRTIKRDLYERVGVTEYWVVDPDDVVVDLYRRHEAGGFAAPLRHTTSDVLVSTLSPGLVLRLQDIQR